MRPIRDGDLHFFVDETGDPSFYNAKGKLIVGEPGCSARLMLGFVRIKDDPTEVRQKMLALHQEVLDDPYFQQLPSFADTSVAFHANKDAPEARYLVFKLIRELNFKAVFVVSQKDERFFQKQHHGKTNEYYDDLVARLFQNSLHRYTRNYVTIASRGSRPRQRPLETAIERARLRFHDIYNVHPSSTQVFLQVQSPKGEPCLSVVDYIGWALQRAYNTGDMKFYNLIADRVGLIQEINARKKPVCYNRKHPFRVS